jgi:hypothetical protein
MPAWARLSLGLTSASIAPSTMRAISWQPPQKRLFSRLTSDRKRSTTNR